jgi:hypothetical protein
LDKEVRRCKIKLQTRRQIDGAKKRLKTFAKRASKGEPSKD